VVITRHRMISWRMNVATPRTARDATRRIGGLLPALAAMAGLDALIATLGESSPVVQRLRENG
jgi:hypothetical protein